MNYQAFYINLDKSSDRRARMERASAEFGLGVPFHRFPGVQVDQGRGRVAASELGCYLSHLRLLQQASKETHTLVLEDDVEFSPRFLQGLELAQPFLDSGRLDVVFLGNTVLFHDIGTHRALVGLRRRLRSIDDGNKLLMLDAGKYYMWGAFAYAVARHARPRILEIMGSPQRLDDPVEVDRLFKSLILAGKLKAGLVFPYVVGVNPVLPTTMHGRKGPGVHELHCALVNTYLAGNTLDGEVGHWNEILSGEPDRHALSVARMIYRALAEAPEDDPTRGA